MDTDSDLLVTAEYAGNNLQLEMVVNRRNRTTVAVAIFFDREDSI